MSKPLIPAQRHERIQEYLTLHKIAPSSDLSVLLGVSEATVRRDLEKLENEGILYRTHGGAILTQHLLQETEYTQRAKQKVREKRAIGRIAASLIEDGDTVFINSGTTTTQLIRQIRSELDITVVTNNLIAALEVGETGYDLILIGGEFQPKSNSVAGRFAIENLSQIYADKAFIGVDGISLKHGCTVPSNSEAEVIQLMLERTNGIASIVTDHSKWGMISNFEVAKIDQVHRIITDSGLIQNARSSLARYSIDLLYADQDFNDYR